MGTELDVRRSLRKAVQDKATEYEVVAKEKTRDIIEADGVRVVIGEADGDSLAIHEKLGQINGEQRLLLLAITVMAKGLSDLQQMAAISLGVASGKIDPDSINMAALDNRGRLLDMETGEPIEGEDAPPSIQDLINRIQEEGGPDSLPDDIG